MVYFHNVIAEHFCAWDKAAHPCLGIITETHRVRQAESECNHDINLRSDATGVETLETAACGKQARGVVNSNNFNISHSMESISDRFCASAKAAHPCQESFVDLIPEQQAGTEKEVQTHQLVTGYAARASSFPRHRCVSRGQGNQITEFDQAESGREVTSTFPVAKVKLGSQQ